MVKPHMKFFKEGVSFQITLLSCLKHPHDFNDIQKQK